MPNIWQGKITPDHAQGARLITRPSGPASASRTGGDRGGHKRRGTVAGDGEGKTAHKDEKCHVGKEPEKSIMAEYPRMEHPKIVSHIIDGWTRSPMPTHLLMP